MRLKYNGQGRGEGIRLKCRTESSSQEELRSLKRESVF